MKIGQRSIAILVLAASMMVIVTYVVYFLILRKQSSEYAQNWIQTELVDLQQGNILRSVMKLQRNVDDGSFLRGVVLEDGHGRRELVKIGERFESYNLPSTVQKFEYQVSSMGYFTSIVALRVSDSHHLSLLIRPKYATLYFALNIITLIVIAGSAILFSLSAARREERAREILVRKTIEEFVGGDKPSDFLRENFPMLVSRWIDLKGDLLRANMRAVEMQASVILADQAKLLKHDIASPLSLLRIVAQKIDTSESLKDTLTSVVRRIDEIVSSLDIRVSSLRERLASNMTVASLLARIRDDKLEELGQSESENSVLIFLDLQSNVETPALKLTHGEIERVFSNLINNSVEAAKSAIEIRLGYRAMENELIFFVSDNGPGIPADVLRDLEKGKIASRKTAGTGMGLQSLRRLVEKIGGTVSIVSDKSGTRVEFSVPWA